MAKGKGGGYNLKAALKVVNQLGKQMGAEGTADYNVALSALTAGQKNLSKQTRAFTRDMLLSQAQNQAALGSLAQRARSQTKAVTQARMATTSRYGAALGASAAAQYNPAAAVAAGTGNVVTGQAKQGKGIGRVGETVAGIAKAGVRAQESAAQYSLNQALQQRNIIDSQTLASLTGQMYQTAMQYNMQWDMWKKQQQYTQKQAEKAQDGQFKQLADTLPDTAPALGVDAWKLMNEAKANGEEMAHFDAGTAAATWAQENGISDPNEIALMAATLAQLKRQGDDPATYDTGVALQDAITKLYSGAKGWDRLSPALLQSIAAGTHTEFLGAFGSTVTAPPEPSVATQFAQGAPSPGEFMAGRPTMNDIVTGAPNAQTVQEMTSELPWVAMWQSLWFNQ